MRTENHVKSMFNASLIRWNKIKKEWSENGNNFHGEWYIRNSVTLNSYIAELNTLRQVLDYYSEEPFKLD